MPASRQNGSDRGRMRSLQDHRLSDRKWDPLVRCAAWNRRSRWPGSEERFRVDDSRIEVLTGHGKQVEWLRTGLEAECASVTDVEVD